MKLLDVITAAGGRVSGGDPFLWKCFGSNANYMEFRDVDGEGVSHCIFDTKTYEVYQIHVEVPLTSNEAGAPELAFQWTNPDYVQQYLDECKAHDVDPNVAWDNFRYTLVHSESLILKYVKDIGETNYEDLPTPGTDRVLDMPGTFGGAKIVWPSEET